MTPPALRNLLAQPAFVAAVGSTVHAADPVYPSLALAVVTVKPSDAAGAQQMLQVEQRAVVRILRGGGTAAVSWCPRRAGY